MFTQLKTHLSIDFQKLSTNVLNAKFLPSWLLHRPSQRISEPSLELGILHSHPSTSEEYPQSLFILPFFIWRSGVPEIRQLSMEASVVLEFWSPNSRHLSEQDLWVFLSLPLDWVLSHCNGITTQFTYTYIFPS